MHLFGKPIWYSYYLLLQLLPPMQEKSVLMLSVCVVVATKTEWENAVKIMLNTEKNMER